MIKLKYTWFNYSNNTHNKVKNNNDQYVSYALKLIIYYNPVYDISTN